MAQAAAYWFAGRSPLPAQHLHLHLRLLMRRRDRLQ